MSRFRSDQPGRAGGGLKVKVSLATRWTAPLQQLSSTDHERYNRGLGMMHDLIGMGLMAILFVLVIASLAIRPGQGRATPRRSKLLGASARRSPAWLSIISAARALSVSRS